MISLLPMQQFDGSSNCFSRASGLGGAELGKARTAGDMPQITHVRRRSAGQQRYQSSELSSATLIAYPWKLEIRARTKTLHIGYFSNSSASTNSINWLKSQSPGLNLQPVYSDTPTGGKSTVLLARAGPFDNTHAVAQFIWRGKGQLSGVVGSEILATSRWNAAAHQLHELSTTRATGKSYNLLYRLIIHEWHLYETTTIFQCATSNFYSLQFELLQKRFRSTAQFQAGGKNANNLIYFRNQILIFLIKFASVIG